MIYLLAQMTLALCLAVAFGAAIGWLVHRSKQAKYTQRLRKALAQREAQLAQAQSDVGMLTDDYDELKRQTVDEINALREENQQIPYLNTNLEKSQLLVRQMMQKHEARVRELNKENEKLKQRLKAQLLDNQIEPAVTDTQSTDEHVSDTTDSASRTKASNFDLVSATPPAVDSKKSEQSSGQTRQASDKHASSTTKTGTQSESVSEMQNSVADKIEADAEEIDATAEELDDADPFDQLMAVDDELRLELDEDGLSEEALVKSEIVDIDASQAGDPIEPDQQLGFELTSTAESDDKSDTVNPQDPDEAGAGDESVLFTPVEDRDDLQKIFGIGPVTEKALNELGITSYAQLADLKQHEIDRIADALQIVPGRIERDNWVGSARRQLENVLEEL